MLASALILPSVFAAFSPAVTTGKSASAAASANSFRYDTYEGGGYYEINYYLDIHNDFAGIINEKIPAANGKTGIIQIFDSIEKFFIEYEKLFFNNANAQFSRNKDVAEYNAVTNPYYKFNMYIYFADDGDMSAGEKYREYFRYAKSEPVKPTKKGFFADRYEDNENITAFFIPDGMPEYAVSKNAEWNYDQTQGLAILIDIMLPFLLYGNQISFDTGVKIDYGGLVSLFPGYFTDGVRDVSTRAKIFENYKLYHSLSASTTYIKTNADKKQGLMGDYIHVWNVSYSSANASLDPNRLISVTYIQPKTINMYFFAIIIAVSFIGLSAFFIYALPKITERNKEKF